MKYYIYHIGYSTELVVVIEENGFTCVAICVP